MCNFRGAVNLSQHKTVPVFIGEACSPSQNSPPADCADSKNKCQMISVTIGAGQGRAAVNVARTEELRSKIRTVTLEVAVWTTMKNWKVLFVIVTDVRSRIPPRQ
jgi:hypothetical protein